MMIKSKETQKRQKLQKKKKKQVKKLKRNTAIGKTFFKMQRRDIFYSLS